ncbi:BrnT family toxin [Paracidobacterium acidisoli]|uniref:BrnT family toxin n=1 Tax=Paracidobacterium acidisoli TaxID=2303751 RepID=A0A372IRZ0_9BACT|nr:BrnT family toxin [Paracidobacterium acidisoli]
MILFEWDEAKAESNRRKHGVTFEEAMIVFDDPNAVFVEDRMVDGELRWHVIGFAAGTTLLLVAHTLHAAPNESKEIVRLISARPATRRERILYGKNCAKDADGY